jgi:hypothetical protein
MPTRSDLDRRDETFEDMLAELEHQHGDTRLTPDQRQERLAHVREAPTETEAGLRFAKLYYPEIFEAPWSDLHHHIASLEEGKRSISGFRKAGKSALTYVVHVIRRVAEQRPGMVGVVLRTLDNAEQRLASLSRLILSNELLCYDYGIEAQSNGGAYRILNHVHLVAGSVSTGLRNYVDDSFDRFGVLIGDDLYDKESVRSELDNRRVYEFVVDEMWGQLEDDGLCVVLGNKINSDSPICKLEEEYPEGHYSFPIVDPETEEPNWPEVYGEEEVEQMKKEIPHDVWQAQYLDDPIEVGDVFDPDWLATVNVGLVTIEASITTVDPAQGQSPAACFKGITSLGLTSTGETVVLDLYGRKEPYPDVFDYLFERIQRLPQHRLVYWENDFAQWSDADPYYTDWKKHTGHALPIMLYVAADLETRFRAADKESRIMTLVHPHQTTTIAYDEQLKGSSDWEVFKEQYKGYPNEGDDVLDALAAANILIMRYQDGSGPGGRVRSVETRTRPRPRWSGSFH